MQHARLRRPQENGVDEERRQKQRDLGEGGANHRSAVPDESSNQIHSAKFTLVRINALVQIPQDARGDAPDVALAERNGVIPSRHALPIAAVQRVVLCIHEESERHLERLGDFRRRHGLPGASSVQRALGALLKDELVVRDRGGEYRIAGLSTPSLWRSRLSTRVRVLRQVTSTDRNPLQSWNGYSAVK